MTEPRHQPDLAAEAINSAIARRIAALRRAKLLSFDDLAARSAVSKGTLVQIEQGRANPSIATLCRVATALRVSVADLLADASEVSCPVEVLDAQAARTLWTGPHGGSATLVVGARGPDMLELWRWVLHPGERFEARAHGAGAVELIHVRVGVLTLTVDDTAHLVSAGHSAVASTDRAHAYQCGGRGRTEFIMVVSERVPA